MSTFTTYFQQADNFITKQIEKFEQQKRGNRSPPRANGFNQMSQYSGSHSQESHGRPPSQGGYPGSPVPQQHCGHQRPPAGPMAPQGWTQEYDTRSQRWYYIERSTGRSQWEPPSYAPPRAATFQPEVRMPSPHENWNRQRERASSQPQRPGSSASGGWHGGQGGGPAGGMGIGRTDSPGQGLHTQLPPGSYLDMKTGKVVSSMFPEGQTHQSWQQEIQSLR
jgi:hypothetical protein